jgi:hypothetical protein
MREHLRESFRSVSGKFPPVKISGNFFEREMLPSDFKPAKNLVVETLPQGFNAIILSHRGANNC